MNFENFMKKIQLENEFSLSRKKAFKFPSQVNSTDRKIEKSLTNKDFQSPKSLWIYGINKKGKVNFQKQYALPFSKLSSENQNGETSQQNQNIEITLNPPVEILKTKQNLYTSYSKMSEIRYVSIDLASSQTMKHWAEKTLPNGKILGEVTSANTLHHKSFKPLKGGLFCERIFGPLKDFECACGTRQRPSEDEYQKILEHRQTQRKFCPICDVEYTWSIIRRYQMGYIQLASPVTHIWYLKANPSYLSILLDMKRSHLDNIVYCSQTLTLENGFKASQVFLPLSPLNLLKSWQKIVSGNSSLSYSEPKKWSEVQKSQVQLFLSNLHSMAPKKAKEKKELFLQSKKAVRNSIEYQRISNSSSFSRPFDGKSRQEKSSFRGSSKFLAFPFEKPKGNIQEKNQEKKSSFETLKGTSADSLFQNYYKNALKISQFRNHRILEKIFSKIQQNPIKLSFNVVEPYEFSSKVESADEDRFIRILLFCFQKHIFEKLFNKKTQKSVQSRAISEFMTFKKTKNIPDFSSIGIPPPQSTPVNGKSVPSVPLTTPHFSFSLPFELKSPLKNPEEDEKSFFQKDRFLIDLISIYFTKATIQKQVSEKYGSFFSLNSTFLEQNQTAHSSGVLLYLKKQKNYKKTIKLSKEFSVFSPFSKFDSCSDNTCQESELHAKVGVKRLKSLQIPNFDQPFYFSKRDFQKKIRKNRNRWKSGSLALLSFPTTGQTFFKQKNQILDFIFFPQRKKGYNSRYFKNRKFPKTIPFSLRFDSDFPKSKDFSSVKGSSENIVPFSLEFISLNEKKEDFLNPENKAMFFSKVEGIRSMERLKKFQKGSNKRELKVRILAQQMTKQNHFVKSYRFIRPFDVPGETFLNSEKSGQKETKTTIGSLSETNPPSSLTSYEKLQTFLEKQKRKEIFPVLDPWSPFMEESPIEGVERKRQRKNELKAKHCLDSLRNNIYCLSHRYRWGNDQYWQYFSYYSLAPRDFEDSIIPVYQNRLNLSLFPSFASSASFSYEADGFRSGGQEKFKNNYSTKVPRNSFLLSSFSRERKEKTTSLTGAGILQKLLSEFEPQILGDTSELKKLDKQNRIFLNEFNRKIHLLKTLTKRGFAEKAEKKQLKELCQKRDQLVARTKLVRTFFRKKTNPSSMILTTLPVLPPDLRPILKIQNQIAASDLNRLYQRVIYRNDRLKKFKKDLSLSYSFEIKYAQKLLQEAVDNLIQNGKGGTTPERDARGRPLKSLSEILKGKGGRFRQYLLGKRVDYSGRSVIVVGPSLKLHECGLPREIALELFLPFLIQRIIHYKFSRTVIGAKTFMKTNKNFTNSILSEIMQSYPILLNRAPTLHRLGFQAFQPRLVEGRAILLHPLVCPAFNADFDGDQMAVHIPLTVEARAEAWKLMFARNHLISSATGEPIILPSQDMVLGCYYLTTEIAPYFSPSSDLLNRKAENQIREKEEETEKKRTNISYFTNFEQVLKLYQLQRLKTHENVWVKWKKPVNTFNKLLNTQMVSPREIRILKNGNWQEIRPKYIRWFTVDYLLMNQYICTTPGRILFYQMTQKCISN